MKYIPEILAIALVAFIFYTLVIWSPYSLYAEAKCLDKGYPEHKLSVGLEIYCLNLDGSITVNVEKL